jgi:hypothetical protein
MIGNEGQPPMILEYHVMHVALPEGFFDDILEEYPF